MVPPPLRREINVSSILAAAGWPIWLLIATSVIGVALIFERSLALRHRYYLSERSLQRAFDLASQPIVAQHQLTELQQDSGFGMLSAQILSLQNQPASTRQEAAEQVGRDLAFRLHRYLGALATVAVIAPLLGLFGTVIGMIELFGAYQPQGSDPSQLAQGISIALYNTGFGILIAIVALIAHRFFSARADFILHRLEYEASRLNRLIESRQT